MQNVALFTAEFFLNDTEYKSGDLSRNQTPINWAFSFTVPLLFLDNYFFRCTVNQASNERDVVGRLPEWLLGEPSRGQGYVKDFVFRIVGC